MALAPGARQLRNLGCRYLEVKIRGILKGILGDIRVSGSGFRVLGFRFPKIAGALLRVIVVRSAVITWAMITLNLQVKGLSFQIMGL